MIPRLYDKSDTTWTSYGICPLIDAIKCTVTEERNGQFVLDMVYARDGRFAEELTAERIILADPCDRAAAPEPFRIATLEYDIAGNIEIHAEHISYQLSSVIVGPITKNTRYAQAAMRNVVRDALLSYSCPFTFNSDVGEESDDPVEVGPDKAMSVKDYLGGTEGSVLDTYGGEFYWHGWTVDLLKNRGADNGVRIAYGKNLTSLKYEIDMSTVITGVVAYYQSGETYVQSARQTGAHPFGYSRDVAIDASQSFKRTPTVAQLNTWARRYLNKHKQQVSISVDVKFIPLWQTEEYKDFYDLEHVKLCDTVEVIYPDLNIDVSAKVVKTVYNVLADRYDSLSISTTKRRLSDTIYQLMKKR